MRSQSARFTPGVGRQGESYFLFKSQALGCRNKVFSGGEVVFMFIFFLHKVKALFVIQLVHYSVQSRCSQIHAIGSSFERESWEVYICFDRI